MAEKIMCVLAGFDEPSNKKIEDMLNLLQQNGFSGEQTKNLIPHFTIATYSNKDEKVLIELINKVSLELKRFIIEVNHIGVFEGGRVLFLSPAFNEELIRLKECFGRESNWTPHSTLLIDDSKVIYKALPIVISNFSTFKATVSTLHLFEFWPVRHICSFELGEGK